MPQLGFALPKDFPKEDAQNIQYEIANDLRGFTQLVRVDDPDEYDASAACLYTVTYDGRKVPRTVVEAIKTKFQPLVKELANGT